MICLTLDIEERFHSHLTPADAPRLWTAHDGIARMLDFLTARGRPATFFVVSELAERYPQLVRRMAAQGFEVASHSHTHLRLDRNDEEVCKADIARSKDVLEQTTGVPVLGFRAPSWSARRSDHWLFQHLAELGFRYDSSLFPFPTHLYGSWGNPVHPTRLPSGLLEIPPSVATLGPLRLPYGGGFYFRLYPPALTRGLLARDLEAGRSPVVYFHPWDFEPAETRMETGLLNRFIGNHASAGAWDRFTALIAAHPTVAMRDVAAAFPG